MTEREMRNVESANLPEQAVPTKRWRKGLGSAGSRDDRMLFTGDIHNKGSRLCPMIEEAANRVDAGTCSMNGPSPRKGKRPHSRCLPNGSTSSAVTAR